MKTLPLLILVIFVSSCGVYVTQSVDIPLIDHKNDLRIDAGANEVFTAGNATVSYGITKNLAVQAYGNFGSHNTHFYHGAIGWYNTFNKKQVMEVYAGVGNGYGYYSNHDMGKEDSGNYQLYFGQFNYGVSGFESGIWDFGFGVKTGVLHSNILTEYTPGWPGYEPPQTNTDDNFLIEPQFLLRVGGKHLKFSVKGGVTYIKNLSSNSTLPYYPINVSIGLNYRL